MTDEKKPDEGVFLNEMLSTSTQTGSSTDVEAIFTPEEIRKRSGPRADDVLPHVRAPAFRAVGEIELSQGGWALLAQQELAKMRTPDEQAVHNRVLGDILNISPTTPRTFQRLGDMLPFKYVPTAPYESLLKFPEVPGVSHETLEALYQQELTNRRKRVVEIHDTHEASLRSSWMPNFPVATQSVLDDIERCREAKNSRRRKAAKKRRKSR